MCITISPLHMSMPCLTKQPNGEIFAHQPLTEMLTSQRMGATHGSENENPKVHNKPSIFIDFRCYPSLTRAANQTYDE